MTVRGMLIVTVYLVLVRICMLVVIWWWWCGALKLSRLGFFLLFLC